MTNVMLEVPPAIPVTTPVLEPIVATPPELLVQVPPPVASVNVVVSPTQTFVVPVIATGSGFTVTTIVEKHVPPLVESLNVVVVPWQIDALPKRGLTEFALMYTFLTSCLLHAPPVLALNPHWPAVVIG